MKSLFTLAVLISFTSSCQSGENQTKHYEAAAPLAMTEAKMAQPEEDQATAGNPEETTVLPPATTNRKIIRNASLRFRVDDLAASGKRINGLVKQVGGIITSSEDTRSEGQIQTMLTVRVPADKLDAFVDMILKESIYTDTKTITAEDITRRFVDTEARIRSKKATEEKYLQLLKQAKNVQDVLEVEGQLRQMREEIEVQEALLREMKNDVAMSTVNASYYQEVEGATNPESPFYVQIVRNLRDGFGMVGDFLVGIFYFLPLLLVITVPGWFLVRWWRRRKRKTN